LISCLGAFGNLPNLLTEFKLIDYLDFLKMEWMIGWRYFTTDDDELTLSSPIKKIEVFIFVLCLGYQFNIVYANIE